jgi:hypothetical protein
LLMIHIFVWDLICTLNYRFLTLSCNGKRSNVHSVHIYGYAPYKLK